MPALPVEPEADEWMEKAEDDRFYSFKLPIESRLFTRSIVR